MYCIKSIKKEDLAGYLLNPFERSFMVDRLIYQKYEADDFKNNKEHLIDYLYVLDNSQGRYELGSIIDYENKDIFVQESQYFNLSADPNNNYKKMNELRWKISDQITSYISANKELRKDKIESHPNFLNYYEIHKKDHFEQFVTTALKVSRYSPVCEYNIENTIANYIDTLTVEETIDAYHDKLDKLYDFADKLLFCDHLLNVLAFEKVKKEAKEYVDSGKLSDKHQKLKNCYEAIKECPAVRFTVVDIHGNRVSCKNVVHIEPLLYGTGENDYKVYLYDIKEITYKGKKIYEAI